MTSFGPIGEIILNLNVACGEGWELKGWTGLDLYKSPGGIVADIRDGLPFRDMSIDAIFCSHFLEHLSYPDEVDNFMKECYRVLRCKAPIRFSVPDIFFLAKMIQNENFYQNAFRDNWKNSAIDTFIHIVYGWGHKWGYSVGSLCYLLREYNFTEVSESLYQNSKYDVFRRGGLDNRENHSFFVEGVRSC